MGTKSKQIKTNGKKTHRNQKIPIKCVRCKESFFVKINSIDYMDWKNGEKDMRELFPYLSHKEKNSLISNLCDKCQVIVKEEFLKSF